MRNCGKLFPMQFEKRKRGKKDYFAATSFNGFFFNCRIT